MKKPQLVTYTGYIGFIAAAVAYMNLDPSMAFNAFIAGTIAIISTVLTALGRLYT